MADEQVPPVVAVVVTNDPGPWLEDCLQALANQDYAALSTLVVDAGSSQPLAERVAAAAPSVYLHSVAVNDGFGPSANAVLGLVEGAAFYLFCHDDVVPALDAVRRLVEESFRSNAAVVCPKLVDFHDPNHLRQLGLGADRFGAPVGKVQPGELDQGQHDEVRDVFAAPGGCTLVRADLFAALGGFDPAISMLGEDVDFCWRARLAGARVVAAPAARVRHLEATASRQRPLPEARGLQWRHELRAVLKNYGRLRRGVVVAELPALSLVEVVYFAARHKRWRVRLVLDAWRWNLARRTELRIARRVLASSRRISDSELCAAMQPHTFRHSRFAQRLAEGAAHDRELARPWRPGRGGGGPEAGGKMARAAERLSGRRAAVVLALAAVVLLAGSRSLLAGRLPLIGGLVSFPPPLRLLGDFFGGWHDAGLQGVGPSSPALAMIGAAGLVLGGATSLVFKLALLLAVVLGAVGAARLARPYAGAAGRAAAAVVYLFLPLAWNDVSRGDIEALAIYACVPWVLARLATAASGHGRPLGDQVVGMGMVLAVSGSFAPLIVPLEVVLAVALVVASFVVAGVRAGRAALPGLVVATGGALAALAFTFPWSVTYFQSATAWSIVSGVQGDPSGAPSISQMLRFDVGPIGRGSLNFGFLVASLLVVLIGRGPRLTWGARMLLVGFAAFLLAWLGGRGWLGPGGGDARALLAPAAACTAAACGLGAAALASDLARSGLGWRQVAAGLCGVAAVAGLLPVLGASRGGRWGLPENGYDAVLSFLPGSGGGAASPLAVRSAAGEVLWLGDPAAVPVTAWQVAPGFAAAVSVGLPDGTRLFPSPSAGLMRYLGTELRQAESSLTVRLGASIARAGIRYLVVPAATAPVLPGVQTAIVASPPAGLIASLSAQQDLSRLVNEGRVAVFENLAWRPGVAPLEAAGTTSHGTPALPRELGLAASLVALAGALWWRRRRRRRSPRHLHHRRSPDRDVLPETPGGPTPAPGPDLIGAGR